MTSASRAFQKLRDYDDDDDDDYIITQHKFFIFVIQAS